MASATHLSTKSSSHAVRRANVDAPWVRWTLTTIALLFLAFFLVLPLVAVFGEALRKGIGAYFAAFNDPDALAAVVPEPPWCTMARQAGNTVA